MWILLTLASILWVTAWMAIGVRYAKSQSAALYRRAKKHWTTPRYVEDDWRGALRMRAFFWPCYIFMSAMTQPVHDQRSRVAELKAENLSLIDEGLANKDDEAYIKILMSLTRANNELIKQLEI